MLSSSTFSIAHDLNGVLLEEAGEGSDGREKAEEQRQPYHDHGDEPRKAKADRQLREQSLLQRQSVPTTRKTRPLLKELSCVSSFYLPDEYSDSDAEEGGGEHHANGLPHKHAAQSGLAETESKHNSNLRERRKRR
jgi:hypothetical protein